MSENEKLNIPSEVDDSTTILENRRNFLKMGGIGIAALALGHAAKATTFANNGRSLES